MEHYGLHGTCRLRLRDELGWRRYRAKRMTGEADQNLDAAVEACDEFIVDYVRVWDEVQ